MHLCAVLCDPVQYDGAKQHALASSVRRPAHRLVSTLFLSASRGLSPSYRNSGPRFWTASASRCCLPTTDTNAYRAKQMDGTSALAHDSASGLGAPTNAAAAGCAAGKAPAASCPAASALNSARNSSPVCAGQLSVLGATISACACGPRLNCTAGGPRSLSRDVQVYRRLGSLHRLESRAEELRIPSI